MTRMVLRVPGETRGMDFTTTSSSGTPVTACGPRPGFTTGKDCCGMAASCVGVYVAGTATAPVTSTPGGVPASTFGDTTASVTNGTHDSDSIAKALRLVLLVRRTMIDRLFGLAPRARFDTTIEPP